jgi:peptide/nickel transport system permease protein
MRSTVMSIKDNEFVEAARATGSRHIRIIFRHILPNTVAPLIVNATLSIGVNIMGISGLSFIGLGVKPPTPEWGSILAAGRTYIRDFWPIIVFPSAFIVLTLFGFNVFGDALRDALDPRLKD